MQYILTEKEYIVLNARKAELSRVQEEQLQKVCTMACNNTPVSFWKNDEPKIWGCILTEEQEHYCDCCPVQDECPHEYKNWSK